MLNRDDDYYKILEIEPTTDFNLIKKAYKKQALKHHPDKGGNQEDFKFLSNIVVELEEQEFCEEYYDSIINKKSAPKSNNRYVTEEEAELIFKRMERETQKIMKKINQVFILFGRRELNNLIVKETEFYLEEKKGESNDQEFIKIIDQIEKNGINYIWESIRLNIRQEMNNDFWESVNEIHNLDEFIEQGRDACVDDVISKYRKKNNDEDTPKIYTTNNKSLVQFNKTSAGQSANKRKLEEEPESNQLVVKKQRLEIKK